MYLFFNGEEEKIHKCFNTGKIGGFVLLILWTAKFVLFIILFFFIENGDIEKYDNFLDCKNVKKDTFKQFSGIEKFRKIFIAFTVLNIISEIIDKTKDFFDLWDENIDEKDGKKQKTEKNEKKTEKKEKSENNVIKENENNNSLKIIIN